MGHKAKEGCTRHMLVQGKAWCFVKVLGDLSNHAQTWSMMSLCEMPVADRSDGSLIVLKTT